MLCCKLSEPSYSTYRNSNLSTQYRPAQYDLHEFPKKRLPFSKLRGVGCSQVITVGSTNYSNFYFSLCRNMIILSLSVGYWGQPGDDTEGFDIALVRMDHPVIFNHFTQPALLYSGRFPLNFNLDTAGWGLTCNNARNCEPTDLWAASMDVVSDGRHWCGARGINLSPAASLLCSSPALGLTCDGDSGGFLGGRDQNGADVVVGVTSFGDCRTSSAFASVTHYFDWIMRTANRR